MACCLQHGQRWSDAHRRPTLRLSSSSSSLSKGVSRVNRKSAQEKAAGHDCAGRRRARATPPPGPRPGFQIRSMAAGMGREVGSRRAAPAAVQPARICVIIRLGPSQSVPCLLPVFPGRRQGHTAGPAGLSKARMHAPGAVKLETRNASVQASRDCERGPSGRGP